MAFGNHFRKLSDDQVEWVELTDDGDRQVKPWKPPHRRKWTGPDLFRKEFENLKEKFGQGLGGSISINGKKWPIPWTRLLLLSLAVYVLTFKDLQFSLDMKAPLGAPPSSAPPVSSSSSASQSVSALPVTHQEESEDAIAYIDRFEKVARAEMKKYGIPASIKMAQGLLESQAGLSEACRQYNNHFGRPLAGKEYISAWANWRAHSELLKKNYPELFRNGRDYRRWAGDLESSGYNARKGYARDLLRIIETYQLDDLDR